MYPIIAHIYGPLYIYSYGVMIALGVIIFTFFCKNNPIVKKHIDNATLSTLITLGIISGIIGGRLLYFVTNFFHHKLALNTIGNIWEGGFSIMGTLGALIITIIMYMHLKQLPFLTLLDVAGLYGGILQAIARIGCFLAGCCYGTPTKLPWAVTYTHYHCEAPLHIPLHPVQLYSSINYLLIFLFFYCIAQKYYTKPGQLIFGYLICAATERFFMDYLRGDIHQKTIFTFSPDQVVCLFFIMISAFLFVIASTQKTPRIIHESL